MNPSTAKALERALRAMDRPRRAPRRFTLTPLLTAVGCALAYLLLTQLLPRVWATTLPGGLETATTFRGWPGLVWRIAVVAHHHFLGVCVIGAALVLGSLLLTRLGAFGRLLAWLLAVSIVLVNGAILYVTIRVPVEVVISADGLNLPASTLPAVENSP